jgi:uncharacterized protein
MLYPEGFGEDPLHPQETDFKVVFKEENAGHGVLSCRSFKSGDVLAVMAGDIVPEIRQHTLQIAEDRHLYDPYFSGYFLHSCSPNISLDMRKMTVTAIKDIPANSFLYMDYAETEDVLFKQFPCSCGSSNCRGWITGRTEKPHPPASPNRHRSSRKLAPLFAEQVKAN